jgi:hypothetical protein
MQRSLFVYLFMPAAAVLAGAAALTALEANGLGRLR